MVTPLATTISVTMLIGIAMIVFGIVKLVDSICLKSKAKEYELAVKKKTEEISDWINQGKEKVQEEFDKYTN